MTNPYQLSDYEYNDVDEKIIFVTLWIKHDVYGIPEIYYSINEEREFIKIPLNVDENDKPSVHILKQIDDEYDNAKYFQYLIYCCFMLILST